MLANWVSPPAGGSSTACSLVIRDGTPWYDLSVCQK